MREIISAGLDFCSRLKQSHDLRPFQTGQAPQPAQPCSNNSGIFPMDVKATTTQPQLPFKKLIGEEHKQFIIEGQCF